MSKPAKPSADPTGAQHPHPDHLLAFVRKYGDREYIGRTARMIEEKFPGSAAKLLPELRAIWKNTKP